jgi:cytidine deaminase
MFTHPQAHHVPEVIAGISASESAGLLKDFFKDLRRPGP